MGNAYGAALPVNLVRLCPDTRCAQGIECDPALGDMLVRYIFRALLLRWTYLGGPFANYTCNGDDRKALDGMVLRWCSDYFCEPNQKPRQAQRLFWQRYFGHKALALVIATHGVQDWACTITKLGAATAYHDREDFRAAVARSKAKKAPEPDQATTGELGLWKRSRR